MGNECVKYGKWCVLFYDILVWYIKKNISLYMGLMGY